jgi:hypothetical protein
MRGASYPRCAKQESEPRPAMTGSEAYITYAPYSNGTMEPVQTHTFLGSTGLVLGNFMGTS